MEQDKQKNLGGRPKGAKSARSLRQNKLRQVLEQLDPLLAKAVAKAEKILDTDLNNDKVSASVQLQAVKLVVDTSIKLREEVYKKEDKNSDDDSSDNEEESTGAILSFSVINNDKK